MTGWRFIVVGKTSDRDDMAKLTDHYLKQASYLSKSWGLKPIRVVEISPSKAKQVQVRKKDEAEALQKSCGSAKIIALDERGSLHSSAEFSDTLKTFIHNRDELAFIIGGADGLDDNLKSKASLTLALGRLTLPHKLARMVLAEQIYRGFSMIGNHPYHRE